MSKPRLAGSAFLVGVGVGVMVSAWVRTLWAWIVIAGGIAIVALGVALIVGASSRRR
jgi:hypothetical protein